MSNCRVVLQVEGSARLIHRDALGLIGVLRNDGVSIHVARMTVDLGGEYDLLDEHAATQAVAESGVIVDGQVQYPA